MKTQMSFLKMGMFLSNKSLACSQKIGTSLISSRSALAPRHVGMIKNMMQKLICFSFTQHCIMRSTSSNDDQSSCHSETCYQLLNSILCNQEDLENFFYGHRPQDQTFSYPWFENWPFLACTF